VQITNAQNLAAKKDAFARYMKAYNETVAWMYSSPEAVPRYIAFSGLSEPAVRLPPPATRTAIFRSAPSPIPSAGSIS